jgi:hypothetical protein
MPFNSYQVLTSINSDELRRVADQLNDTGLATDEDGLCLGSSLIEHWSPDCTSFIAKFGYSGGPLACSGKFFPAVGAIYVLYDDARHTLESAQAELRRAAARSAEA